MVFFDDIFAEFKKMNGKKIDITQEIDIQKLSKELNRETYKDIRRKISF
tara:strand:- start:4067 stop:4213 length:147 start_codon:yes stop_codon:yes gene_type:complete